MGPNRVCDLVHAEDQLPVLLTASKRRRAWAAPGFTDLVNILT
jgi:hypothetical protein